ncbi:ABC transporter permease subunit [Aeromicrobium sp. SMF47]|uniref:ABC transporter permease subunit n=1 Tax=Aeromicrobium yanjiei TaxID=2662028 RepID=A0A5Q2MMD8_9ACTN|nr:MULTISPECIES: ABC transporter permease [Aeromicrobium]MRJ77296.1 ABC transporter permease subunit [Aeromicrobium yanjiei]MRK01663.1 ABC transporter permease subunit [Aeromicrobium sp. S22]QGG41575.1 ABC transporter permease subunit [Aeromicrobium yanjiei]
MSENPVQSHGTAASRVVPRRSLLSSLKRSRPLRQLRGNRAAMVSGIFLLLLIIVAALAPLLTTQDPAAQTLSKQLQGPSSEHWLGTDMYGRDVYTRLLFSARVTLIAILQALALASLLGIPLGLLAGYVGGWVDALLSRVSDALLSLPPLILAIAIVGILGPGLTNAMIAIGIVLAPPQFRLARGAAQSVSTETYIEAARAMGCSPWRIMWRHVLPNASSPLLVQVTFAAGIIVIAEASLSFLGLGVQSPQSSWGTMLRDAFDNIYDSPWFMVAPALMIVLTILSFSTFGDGLRDALEGRGVIRIRKAAKAKPGAPRAAAGV